MRSIWTSLRWANTENLKIHHQRRWSRQGSSDYWSSSAFFTIGLSALLLKRPVVRLQFKSLATSFGGFSTWTEPVNIGAIMIDNSLAQNEVDYPRQSSQYTIIKSKTRTSFTSFRAVWPWEAFSRRFPAKPGMIRVRLSVISGSCLYTRESELIIRERWQEWSAFVLSSR